MVAAGWLKHKFQFDYFVVPRHKRTSQDLQGVPWKIVEQCENQLDLVAKEQSLLDFNGDYNPSSYKEDNINNITKRIKNKFPNSDPIIDKFLHEIIEHSKQSFEKNEFLQSLTQKELQQKEDNFNKIVLPWTKSFIKRYFPSFQKIDIKPVIDVGNFLAQTTRDKLIEINLLHSDYETFEKVILILKESEDEDIPDEVYDIIYHYVNTIIHELAHACEYKHYGNSSHLDHGKTFYEVQSTLTSRVYQNNNWQPLPLSLDKGQSKINRNINKASIIKKSA